MYDEEWNLRDRIDDLLEEIKENRVDEDGYRMSLKFIRSVFDVALDEFDWTEDPEAESTEKYPAIRVQISGQDGNAFSIIGRVAAALRNADVEESEIDAFRKEAMSGDYDNVLQICFRWARVA